MRAYPKFTVGDRLLIDGREHRFVGACEPASLAPGSPFDLKFEDFRTAAPLVLSSGDLDQAYNQGRLRWLTGRERLRDVAPDVDDNDTPKARIRRLYCQAFDAAPVSKSTESLARFIEETAPTLKIFHKPPSPGALRVWLRERGEERDRRLRFMRDRYHRGPSGMRIEPVAQRVLAAKAAAYFDGIHVNQHAVYCDTRAAIADLNEQRRAAGLHPVRPPSKATVHRYLRQHLDYGHARQRLGERVGGKPFKPIKGSMRADRILEVAIMDHTEIDLGVVDDEHFVSVGRPWLTVLGDVRSRYPLGICLGFEPPSISSAMACLRHALRKKLEVAAEYPEIDGEWLAFGVPDTIVVDNAWEFRSGSFVDACADANINVTFAAIANPEYKAIGERFFGTLNEMLFHRLPGGLPLTPQKRKEIGIDPVRDAVMTVSDLKRLIYQCVIEVYGRAYHKGIKAAPEQVWREQADEHGRYALDLAGLDRGLARLAGERTLSREGITLNNLTYRAEAPLSMLLADLLPRAKRRGTRWGTTKVKVKYHPEDLGHIYVWNEVRQSYVTVPCTQPAYTTGLSEHQHKTVSAYAEAQHLAFQSEDDRCRARVRLQDEIRALIPVSKVRDRRRAQRLLGAPTALEPGDQVLHLETGASPQGVPIGGAVVRKGADRPRRSALFANRKAPRQKPTTDPSAPTLTATVISVPDGSFADVDFGQLQEEARQCLEQD